MSCEIVPLTEEIIARFVYDGERPWIIGTAKIDEVLTSAIKIGDAYAALADGEVVAVAGMISISSGVGHTWLYLNRVSAKRYAKTIIRAIRNEVRHLAAVRGYHRIQTFVEADDRQSIRFTKAYGLQRESTMHAYGPQRQDVDVYAKVLDGR